MIKGQINEIKIHWANHFRIIPTKYPPINFFEKLVDPSLMEEVFYIESLTNDRLRDEVGDISLVREEDRISGSGSSYVMAAFTHPAPSRFSDGTFGIYYASKDMETAIKETVYHTERFLRYTNEPSSAHTRRVLQGKGFLKRFADIRDNQFKSLYDADDLTDSRAFGADFKVQHGWGFLYQSVRNPGGQNIAIFRPNAIKLPVIQTKHLEYYWNGEKVTHYLELGQIVELA